MILGNIIKRSSTNGFLFLVKGDAKKFMYVQVRHKEGYFVLAQIVEIEKEKDETIAKCNILGYRIGGVLKNLRTPLEPDSEVLYADDAFVMETLGLNDSTKGAYIGVLEDRENIPVYLDLNNLITKHVCVLAKSGAGKSFTVSVLLEEIMDRNIPIVVIDPHGEYNSLKYPAEGNKDIFKKFGIKPKAYYKNIHEYSPDPIKNQQARPLKLSGRNLTGSELMHLLPAKLSSSQVGLLYSALSDLSKQADFDQLIMSLQAEEHNAKWTLINVIEYIKKMNIFSDNPTDMNELVQVGKCSIINLRGIPQEVQEVIVYKVVNDLFNARKNGNIPPFFLVLEEAHNYAPERTFGEVKSSSILRQVIAEGRKFGLGVCVITQRPARLEKTILSQCSTQVIMKVTNPNDLKSITSGVEGVTSETENEIVNLHVGSAMIAGVADVPLFVQIRPRKTKHGGEAVDIVGTFADAKVEDKPGTLDYFDQEKDATGKEVLNMIRPKVTKEDIKLLVDKKIKTLRSILVPCSLVSCNDNGFEFNLLLNLVNGQIVTDIERGTGKNFDVKFSKLSDKENKVFTLALNMKQFAASDLFSKSGLMFSEVYDIINSLVKKGLLVKDKDKYVVSDNLSTFLNLKNLAFYEKNEFLGLEYDEKLKPTYDLKITLDLFRKFINVINYKECFIVKYDVEFEK